MADRNLRIRMILEASDRVTRPLRDMAGSSSKLAQSLKASRDRLKDLDKAQADVNAFRSLRAGLRDTTQELGAARARLAQARTAIAEVETPTRKMTAELNRAESATKKLEVTQRAQAASLRAIRTGFHDAGVSARDLTGYEQRLGNEIADTTRDLAAQERRFMEVTARQKRMAAARDRFDRTQGRAAGLAASGAAGIGTGLAVAAPIAASVRAAEEYQSVMTDIGQKADLTRRQSAAMGNELLKAAQSANQLPEALQAGVDTLSGFGLDPRRAVAMMKPIGRAATAYKAEIADLSAAAFAANDNLKVPVEQTARVIDIMAAAGKAGAFEVKDMAGSFPALTAAYQGLGQKGTGAVADLAAALQITRKGAGDSSTAANNLANILQKVTSPQTVKAFEKMGVDLPAALKRAYIEGKTPIEALAELTNKTLKGDLSKLGYLFEDAQVQQGLRPLIQNMEEYRRIRADANGASGVTDRDFADRMNDSAERTKALTIRAQALKVALGAHLLPTIDAGKAELMAFGEWVSRTAERHPLLTKAALLGAAGLGALFLVLGAGGIAIAGIMGPIAILNAGLIAMGVAGGLAEIGLLPIIGTVAAVAAGVALLGAGAYLLYANWGKIGAFFGNLWGGITARFASARDAVTGIFGGMWNAVSSIFSMSIGDIYNALAYFTGYALGALFRFGSSAASWLTGTLPGLLVSGWNAAWSGLTGAIGAAWTWLSTRLPAMLVNAWSLAWAGFKSAMRTAFVTLPAMFFDFGAMIIKGLWNGIKSAPGRLLQGGMALAHSLTAGFKKGADIHSPSRVFKRLGGYVTEGLALGIHAGGNDPVRRLDTISARMMGAVATGLAAPALSVAPAAAAPTGAGLAATGALPPIQIIIHGAPGQSEQRIAELVGEKVRLALAGAAPTRSSGYADTADYGDG